MFHEFRHTLILKTIDVLDGSGDVALAYVASVQGENLAFNGRDITLVLLDDLRFAFCHVGKALLVDARIELEINQQTWHLHKLLYTPLLEMNTTSSHFLYAPIANIKCDERYTPACQMDRKPLLMPYRAGVSDAPPS